MRRPLTLWVLATIITVLSALYQRYTGPTYPVSGVATLDGSRIHYRFLRTHDVTSGAPVEVAIADTGCEGRVLWRRFPSDEPWRETVMDRRNDTLQAVLPAQPPAGKLEYEVRLMNARTSMSLPAGRPVTIRFKGEVPAHILIIHILAIFGAMLLSTRTGLEVLRREPRYGRFIPWTVGFLLVGGAIFGPIVQKYAFGAYWTGWPFGHDLTDNKTAVALFAWIVAALVARRRPDPRRWVAGAAIVTFLVFAIPHSMLGSEIDYRASAGVPAK